VAFLCVEFFIHLIESNSMKYLFLAAFILLAGAKVSAQNNGDAALDSYIKTKGYVLFTDTAHLSKIMMPYYSKLTAYLSAEKLYELKDIYTSNPMHMRHLFKNKDAEMEIIFSVIDKNGIKALMDYEAKLPKAKDTIINGIKARTLGPAWFGDPSGREYTVVFNEKTGSITSGRSQ